METSGRPTRKDILQAASKEAKAKNLTDIHDSTPGAQKAKLAERQQLAEEIAKQIGQAGVSKTISALSNRTRTIVTGYITRQ